MKKCGNVKDLDSSLSVTISVFAGPDCHNPEGPVGGTKSCSSYGGTKFCTVMCNPGSQLYKATKSWWQCNAGVWDPSDSIPDCVGMTTALFKPYTLRWEGYFFV